METAVQEFLGKLVLAIQLGVGVGLAGYMAVVYTNVWEMVVRDGEPVVLPLVSAAFVTILSGMLFAAVWVFLPVLLLP